MAKQKRIELFINCREDEYRPDVNAPWEYVCIEGLTEYFGIPKGVENISVILSDEAIGDSSYKVLEGNVGTYTNYILIENSNGELDKEHLGTWAKDQLKDFGLPCYVSVEY